MKKKILMLCMGCFLASLTAQAQWVVSDPGNLAQGIINAAKDGHHRPLLQRHAAKPKPGAVLYQQEYRGVLPACQETERPGPCNGSLRFTERTLLVILIPNAYGIVGCKF